MLNKNIKQIILLNRCNVIISCTPSPTWKVQDRVHFPCLHIRGGSHATTSILHAQYGFYRMRYIENSSLEGSILYSGPDQV